MLKLPAGRSKVKGQGAKIEDVNTVLFDLHNDPKQNNPIIDNDIETQLIESYK